VQPVEAQRHLEERLLVEEEELRRRLEHHRLRLRLEEPEDLRLRLPEDHRLRLLQPKELLLLEDWIHPWEIHLAMTLEIRMN